MDDIAGIHSEALRYLEIVRERLELEPHEMRVLDYGCGQGDAVVALRRLGYQAIGADIWAEGLELARRALREAGFGAEDVVSLVAADGRTALADDQFQFIYSQEVFEHVADLDQVGSELSRLTAPSGYGLHIFPPRRRVQEPHFFMPFVHWLPKNRLRKGAIVAMCLAGLGGRPPQIPGAGPLRRASFLYEYSVSSTFYRHHDEVASAMREAGLDTCFVVTNHRKIQSRRMVARIANRSAVRPALDWLLLTFFGVNFLVSKPAGHSDAKTVKLGSWRGNLRSAHGVQTA